MSKHKLGLTALSYIPSGRELHDFMERVFARQYALAETDQDKVEIAAWIRNSRHYSRNGRKKNGRGKRGRDVGGARSSVPSTRLSTMDNIYAQYSGARKRSQNVNP